MNQNQRFIAFAGPRRIASGDLIEVALAASTVINRREPVPVLIFDDSTSEQVEIDLRGSAEDVRERLELSRRIGRREAVLPQPDSAPGPGRPKLGVIGREVTLLPRHWDWLNSQPGGASVTLRKLVEAAKRSNAGEDRIRAARDATYKFMLAMAGDLPGYEEATRVLFARDKNRLSNFKTLIGDWPKDIRDHTLRLIKEQIRLETA